MMKFLGRIVLYLGIAVCRASSQQFEASLSLEARNFASEAQRIRQNVGRSQSIARGTLPPLSLADVMDEAKVGVAGRFIVVSPGHFVMGSPVYEEGRSKNEPQHEVTLTKGLELQATAVTQLQFFLVTGRNPSEFRKEENCNRGEWFAVNGLGLCINHPVENVSWDEARQFIEALNASQRSCVYRLPTEAEREYAARAGTSPGFPYSFGFNDLGGLDDHAWHLGNSDQRTHAVACRKPNPWGLFDMHGNVREWVEDWYDFYPTSDSSDPEGPATGVSRVIRGGSWKTPARTSRSAARGGGSPAARWPFVGFRLVRSCR